MNYIGLDIGGTSVKMGLIDDNYNVLCKASYSVDFDDYKTHIFDTVLLSIDKFVKDNNIDMSEVEKFGVSSMGQIDSKLGIVYSTAGHVGAYGGTPVCAKLEEKYGKKAYILNDANAAALGELASGAVKGCKNAVVMVVGTGIGGGIIIDGKVVEGKRGFAGEIGHVTIDKNGERCSCGNVGCYERLASTVALVKMVKADDKLSSKFDTEINGKVIFDLYESGDPDIQEVVKAWLYNVAMGIVTLVHYFEPEAIVIGGAISERLIFIDEVSALVKEYCMPSFMENFRILKAELANDAGMIGAVMYAKGK